MSAHSIGAPISESLKARRERQSRHLIRREFHFGRHIRNCRRGVRMSSYPKKSLPNELAADPTAALPENLGLASSASQIGDAPCESVRACFDVEQPEEVEELERHGLLTELT